MTSKTRANAMTSKRIVTRRARSRSIPGETGARDDGNAFEANPFASASATFDAREALRSAVLEGAAAVLQRATEARLSAPRAARLAQ